MFWQIRKIDEQNEAQLNACAEKLGSSVLAWDLLDEVVDLVEWPVTIVSEFDEDLLELPPRLLIEAMKIHQRVFPLERDGKLSNSFLVVTNHPYATDEETAANIAEGNRRVLTARFYDAKFSCGRSSQKTRRHWSKLEGMRWIRNGGTMADKSIDWLIVSKSLLMSLVQTFKNPVVQQNYANATSAQKWI